MWEIKLKKLKTRLHGGSVTGPYRTDYFRHRSKHFAIESPWYYLHLAVNHSRHADREPTIGEYKAYELRASGMPEKYRGTISLSYGTVIGHRFHSSHYFTFDYGGKTADWLELEKKQHERQYQENAE